MSPVVIDHAYFPHIIDRIFAFAPPESQFALSRACSAWRRRAHDRYRHLHDFSVSSNDVQVCKYKQEIRGPAFFSLTSDPALRVMLRSCRVLDVLDVERNSLLGLLVPNVSTVRYQTYPDSYGQLPASVNRLVLHDVFPHVSGPPSLRKVTYTDTAADRISRIVPSGYPSTLKDVTYIYLGKEGCQEDAEACRGRLFSIFWETRKARITLTCVNLPARYKEHITDLAALNPRDVVRCIPLDEYRESIGEKEFAIETDWTTDSTI